MRLWVEIRQLEFGWDAVFVRGMDRTSVFVGQAAC